MERVISPTLKRAYRLIKLIQEIKCSPKQTVEQLIHNLGISKAQFYSTTVTLLANDVAAGDTIQVVCAGGKVGTGEIIVVLEWLEGCQI